MASLTYEALLDMPEMGSRIDRTDVFIETGTYHGSTVFNLEEHFKEIHTIELSPTLYRKVVLRYLKRKVISLLRGNLNNAVSWKIKFHLGDSSKVLPEVASRIQAPALFFLDGHFSSGITARGQKDVPLIDELRFISKREFSDTVIIDDVALFGTNINEDWSDINERSILGCFPQGKIKQEYVYKGRMILIL